MLKPRLTRVADEKEGIDEPDKSNLAGPSFAVDQDIPGVDITACISHSHCTAHCKG
jgi:hypothetical protein